MCTSPITIYANSRHLDFANNISFKYSVPCGSCLECNDSKVNEWKLRCYYEAKALFKNPSAYIIFDTLTFRNEDLPLFSSIFPRASETCWNRCCFNRKMFQDFFKRLRIKLKRLGYDPRGKLRYFLATEYGTDPRFTKRSHAHILFYVNMAIDPVKFSRCVSDSWPYGRTDGVRYVGLSKFYSDKYFPAFNPHAINLVQYVAKYINKQSSCYRSKLHELLMMYGIIHPFWRCVPELRKEFQSLKRQILPFHMQSLRFGYNMIDGDLCDILDNGVILPVTSSACVLRVPLPISLRRKVLQNVVCIDGVKKWIYNEFGRTYLASHYDLMIQKRVDYYSKMIRNLAFYFPDVEIDWFLNQDLKKLAIYSTSVRGRTGLYSAPRLMYENSLNPSMDTPFSDFWYGYNHHKYKNILHGYFISKSLVDLPSVEPIDFKPSSLVSLLDDSCNNDFCGLDHVCDIFDFFNYQIGRRLDIERKKSLLQAESLKNTKKLLTFNP